MRYEVIVDRGERLTLFVSGVVDLMSAWREVSRRGYIGKGDRVVSIRLVHGGAA
jgi:hypothetical protein